MNFTESEKEFVVSIVISALVMLVLHGRCRDRLSARQCACVYLVPTMLSWIVLLVRWPKGFSWELGTCGTFSLLTSFVILFTLPFDLRDEARQKRMRKQ